MPKTDRFQLHFFLLIFAFFIMSGCTERQPEVQVTPTHVPEITSAYLLEHRIVSYLPDQHKKVVSTLPYEIKTFEESYLLRLIAEIPDSRSTKQAHYFLWLERRADNWRDFDRAYCAQFEALKLDPHFSTIRHGNFYKEYTIDFSLEQLSIARDSGLELLLVNQQGLSSAVTLPSLYIEAFLEMLKQTDQ